MYSLLAKSLPLLFTVLLLASGGYDHGTATGKGQFEIDLTWNPFNKISYGQTYAVFNYGITERLDLHGYLSYHNGDFYTWYGGVFYQFLDLNWLDIATAVGIRRKFNSKWTHIFAPQLLYTINLTNAIYFGGSFVDVKGLDINRIDGQKSKIINNYGVAVDIAVFFKLPYKSKNIESLAVGIGGFHPATWSPNNFFLPTYSVDVKFRRKQT